MDQGKEDPPKGTNPDANLVIKDGKLKKQIPFTDGQSFEEAHQEARATGKDTLLSGDFVNDKSDHKPKPKDPLAG